jgi:hypothetical protein|tara:strand:- start:4712 stop:5146 length:435 start_codon:yes stop_codon:yes gene_type:complete
VRINLNTIIGAIAVSFSLLIILALKVNGKTWYDSEGRPLAIKGKKVIRIVVDEEESDKETENVSRVIPNILELIPELSTVKSPRFYSGFNPYSRYHYGYRVYSGSVNAHRHQYYRRGCYRARGVSSRNMYLNYRRGGVSIRAKF